MGTPYFYQIQDHNTQANLCRKYFLSSDHQKWIWSHRHENYFCTMRTETLTTSNKKGQHIWIEDLLNCATVFLFLISIKLKAFCVTQNKTPKMVKKCPPLLMDYHKNLRSTSICLDWDVLCYVLLGKADILSRK